MACAGEGLTQRKLVVRSDMLETEVGSLRANIRETSLVPLFNEQGEKEKEERDERKFS
jgi:hypothetical protein